jgi:DNA-binding LytR/AlgR family response regulator
MKKDRILTISNRNNNSNIPFDKIILITSDGMLTTVYTTVGDRYCRSKNIGAIHKKLDGKLFCRVNNSCVISLSKIKEYIEESEIIQMMCDTKIMPSRRRKDIFLKVYKKQNFQIS